MRKLLSFFVAAIALTLPAQVRSHPSPTVVQVLRNQPLLLGTAWYPEQWPESRWDTDLSLMEAAHMHVVRIAEFAWSTMEPAEDHFDFAWLDRAIALCAKHHIQVVLGTPTAAPPAWLTSKYPDTLRVDEDGRRAEHGNRQQFSFTSPAYRRLSARIAAAMATRYGHNPNVIGWQIDNELAAPSFDPSARAAFHHWLAARYGTIGELNKRWATAYWSQTYDTFDQVPVHSRSENPALLLDWKRFVTDTWISYCNNQIRAMRPHLLATQWITTNTMHWFQGFDHYKLHAGLDLAAWDDYVPDGHLDPILNAAQHDLVRGYKQQNFWLMETQPAFVNWGPINAALPPGVTREMAWQAVAHGADAVLYWQWRPAPNGQEEYHGSVLGADGQPNPIYAEIQHIGADFVLASDALRGTSPHADVAILQDYDSHWAIDFQKHNNKFDYEEQILTLYHALPPAADGGVSTIDMISPLADLSHYKLVLAPSLNVLPNATAQHLLAYVRNGGTLILGPRSGMKDADNGLQATGQPGPLQRALGAKVEQFYALDAPATLTFSDNTGGKASIWGEQLLPTNAGTVTLARYAHANGWLDGKPAAVAHTFGAGTIVYMGASADAATWRHLLLPELSRLHIAPLLAQTPPDVEISERSAAGRRVWIVINHSAEERHIDLQTTGRDLLTPTTSSTSSLDLAPHGVAVVLLESSR